MALPVYRVALQMVFSELLSSCEERVALDAAFRTERARPAEQG
jgi:hypothetical protein